MAYEMYRDLQSYDYSRHFETMDNLKEFWVNSMAEVLKIHEKKDELYELFYKWLDEKKIKIDNTARGTSEEYLALQFLHKVYEENIIITENGVFFRNQREVESPTVYVEIELGNLRKVHKHQGNHYLTVGNDPILGKFFDLLQNGDKTTMNTFYGCLLNPFSKFFNPDLGGSITVRGRSTVSVSALTCEAAFANYFPKNFDALAHFISQVEKERHSQNAYNITRHLNASTEDVLSNMKVTTKHRFYDTLYRLVDSVSQDKKNIMYVKNNPKRFLTLPRVKAILTEISEIISVNNVPFLNPYELPEIEREVNGVKEKYKPANHLFAELKGLVNELLYGYYWYQGDEDWDLGFVTNNTQDTIKSLERQVISLIDTDSNMVYIEVINNMMYEIMGDNLSTLTDLDAWYTVSNTTMFMCDAFVDKSLKRYISQANILPEYHNRIVMKNEFLYDRFGLTSRKKNYVGSQRLKEGLAYPEPKLDIKGLMYKKSNVNPVIGNMVSDIIEQGVVMSPKIDVRGILGQLRKYTTNLSDTLKTQEGLSLFASVKLESLDNLKNASDYRVGAMDLWNELDLGDKIVVPTRFLMVHMNYNDSERMAELYPVQHKLLNDYINKMNNDSEMATLRGYQEFLKLMPEGFINDIQPIVLEGMGRKHINAVLKTLDKAIINFLCLQLTERVRECTDARVRKPLEKLHDEIIGRKFTDLHKFFGFEKIMLQFEELADSFFELVPKMKKHKTTKDMKYIAIPQDLVLLPDFVIDFINVDKIVSQIDNLAAPVIKELHLVSMRGKDNKVMISNALTVF
ncbi:MAG: family B DNA polymerase [Peptostreptococcaceae bacterium]